MSCHISKDEKVKSLFKIIIIGDSGVGKTMLMYNLVYGNRYLTSNITFGVDIGIKEMNVRGIEEKIKLHIWKTNGQKRFLPITRCYYTSSVGCIIVYDVTCRRSFYNVMVWLEDIRHVTNNKPVILVVGTKTDLTEGRMVATEEGKALAEREGVLFAETNITEDPFQLFERITKQIYYQHNLNRVDLLQNTVSPPTSPRNSLETVERCCWCPLYKKLKTSRIV